MANHILPNIYSSCILFVYKTFHFIQFMVLSHMQFNLLCKMMISNTIKYVCVHFRPTYNKHDPDEDEIRFWNQNLRRAVCLVAQNLFKTRLRESVLYRIYTIISLRYYWAQCISDIQKLFGFYFSCLSRFVFSNSIITSNI